MSLSASVFEIRHEFVIRSILNITRSQGSLTAYISSPYQHETTVWLRLIGYETLKQTAVIINVLIFQ